jgi:hypothetical protein
MQTITTNEIKKGDKVLLANGFEAIIDDNKKGNIRLARVFGIYEEIGSIYAHDIKIVYCKTGEIKRVALTDSQKKLKTQISFY